jgi:hypothetical protein
VRRGQLVIVYIGLSVVAILLAWRLVTDWKLANKRYGSARPIANETTPLPATPAPEKAPPVINDIVSKNLFSPDRNNEIVQHDKSQPAPPTPVVFGTMNLGGKYEALMAEAGKTRAFKRVKTGEQMAGYTVLEISDEKVVVDYQGHKTTIDVYQSANSVPRNDVRTIAAPTPSAPVVESSGPPQAQAQSGASSPSRPAAPAAAPGLDVKVTVEGNRKRMERNTPFGPQVWYEDNPK